MDDNELDENARIERDFGNLKAKASEHFDEFLIVVQKGNSFLFQSSHETFAIGAAARVSTRIKERERLEEEDLHDLRANEGVE